MQTTSGYTPILCTNSTEYAIRNSKGRLVRIAMHGAAPITVTFATKSAAQDYADFLNKHYL